jgi:hypothetical protein
VKLWKIKRPAGRFNFEVQPLIEDSYGVWLYARRGSGWEAPHASGELPFDALALVSLERCWVAWWVDDPQDRRLEIDVCLAPKSEIDGWSFVDLELDVVRHENGTVEILDRDEFDTACQEGWISPTDAQNANTVTDTVVKKVRRGEEPLGEEGWRRLDGLRNSSLELP